MDNSYNVSNAISPPTNVDANDASSFFSGIANVNIMTWFIIILILSFLGFNVFVYLAKGTQDITNIFAPLVDLFVGIVAKVTGKTIDVAAEGAKAVVNTTADAVDITAGAIDKGLTSVQNAIPNDAQSSMPSSQTISSPQQDTTTNNTLNKALNTSQSQQQGQDYEASESVTKSGWCYIGEDRGYRSCAQVGVNDKCMSGDIFPSNDICVNPTLRP